MCRFHQIGALAYLTATMHARCEDGGHDLGNNIVQGFGEDTYRVSRGGGVGVLKGDDQDHALARKNRLAVGAVPSVKEPLDPKDTSRSSWRRGLYAIHPPIERPAAGQLHQLQ